MELHIQGLTKTYGNGVQALKDVTFTVPEGVLGLLGPKGAGKSTLIRILATVQEPCSGSIRLGDIDVLSRKQEAQRWLGYLPQGPPAYPKVSAESLLDHLAMLKGQVGRRARDEVVESLLRHTSLWNVRSRNLGDYSAGMRQRFGIAVALLGDPKLILLDEPTAGLDAAERTCILRLVRWMGECRIVLVSAQSIADVGGACTRVASLDRGELRVEAEPLRAVSGHRGPTVGHPLDVRPAGAA